MTDLPKTSPVRSLLVTQSRFNELGPVKLMLHMKKLGFRFKSDACPIKLEDPCRVTRDEGSTHFEQWDPPTTRGD